MLREDELLLAAQRFREAPEVQNGSFLAYHLRDLEERAKKLARERPLDQEQQHEALLKEFIALIPREQDESGRYILRQPDRDENAPSIVLFVAANPDHLARLQLEREFLQLFAGMQDNQRGLSLRIRFSASARQLSRAVQTYRPRILHFSGHGVEEEADFHEAGLVLEGEDGTQIVGGQALNEFFALVRERSAVETVFLNACYSETQARLIVQHVPYVIGMSREVPDELAIAFAGAFYASFALGSDVERAFGFALAETRLEGRDRGKIPVLLKQ